MIKHSLFGFSIFISLMPFNAVAGCDTCMKVAAKTATKQMVSSLQTVKSSVNANIAATDALNMSIKATDAALQATIKLNTSQLVSGLDGQAKRLELAIAKNTKASQNLTNHTVNSIVSAIKQARIAEEIDKNNKIFSEVAQPKSGDIGANRAPLLKQGIVQSNQIWRQLATDMRQWNDDTETSDQAGSAIMKRKLLSEDESVWDPAPFITKNQLTDEESKNAQKLLTMLVNAVPLRKPKASELARGGDAFQYELDRRLINAKYELAHSVLSKTIAEKQALVPISEDDWLQGYVMAKPDQENNSVSLQSVLESETIGRLTSEGWYQDIKTKTQAGILREQVYMQAVNNHMLLKLVEQEEQKLTMLALLTIEELEKNKPKAPQ